MEALDPDKENYVRMSLLVAGVAPRAVRVYFDQEFSPVNLSTTLRKETNKLLDLKSKRVINQAQWNVLFPHYKNGLAESKNFDVTLMICLLRNFASVSPPDGLPLHTDTTPSADLARIKYYRNYLAHHDSDEIDSTYFNTAWTDISDAIKRLGGPAMHQECLDLKVKKLDQTNQEIMLEIRSIKQSVEALQFVHEDHIPSNIRDKRGQFERMGNCQNFKKLLRKGTFKSYENRVYLSGACNVGKSTLASVMIGVAVPTEWHSTDGLNIHYGRNGIHLDSKTMIPLPEGSVDHELFSKILRGTPDVATTPAVSSVVSAPTKENSTSTDKGEETLLVGSKVKPQQLQKESKLDLKIQEDILEEIRKGQYRMEIAPSDLVDFGGQKSFDLTHQLFIQQIGSFVIMFDGRFTLYEDLEEYPQGGITSESIIKHWVYSILTYCQGDDKMPMILFAATHSDLITQDEIIEKKKHFTAEITKFFANHPQHQHIVYDTVFFINATDKDDPELKHLMAKLVEIAMAQPSWGQPMPMAWVPLELQISKMKSSEVNLVTKQKLMEVNEENEDLSLTGKELERFLKVQHSLGKIIYFAENKLDEFIILHPTFLVNVLRAFITDEMFWPKDSKLRNILDTLSHSGKITKHDLIVLWEQDQFKRLMPNDDKNRIKDFVIEILVHLDILVDLKHFRKNKSEAVFYLVPCMVKLLAPSNFLGDIAIETRTICLAYSLLKSAVPAALSFKLIGAALCIWPFKESEGRPSLYYKSAVLCIDDDNELRICAEDDRMIVCLVNKQSRNFISPDIAASVQECLTQSLTHCLQFYHACMGKDMNAEYISALFQIEVGVICQNAPCLLPLSKAKEKSSWICGRNVSHNTNCVLYWVFDKKQKECPSECTGLDSASLSKSLSEKHLVRIASMIGIKSFRKLRIHLGITEDEWEDIEEEYESKGSVAKKLVALCRWMEANEEKATFNKLKGAFEDTEDRRHFFCNIFREDGSLHESSDYRYLETPDDAVLDGLKNHIGTCVIELGIELGIPFSEIQTIMHDCPKDLKGQIHNILIHWKNMPKKKNLRQLMIALKKVKTGGLKYLKDQYKLS